MYSEGWEVEVDVEAARLVQGGCPPWEAMAEAVKNVRRRRAAKKRAEDTACFLADQDGGAR